MDWRELHDEILDNSETDDYMLITRDNLDDLKLGMHIKYYKKVRNKETGKIEEKLFNGGFLIKILNEDKVVNLTLLLKSNIIWRLRFIKYKVYAKQVKIGLKADIRKEYEDEINARKQELMEEQAAKIANIVNNKNKYKVFFDV